jgi:hypothetical protein
VAALRALSQSDVAAFYREVVLEPASRRKLSVHVEGHRAAGTAGTAGAAAEGATAATAEAGAAPAAEGTGGEPAAAAAAAEQAPAEGAAAEEQAAAVPVGPEPERIADLYSWKRRQQLYASFK